MTSAYPGALDTLKTDVDGETDTLESVPHDALHNDANAAIKAVQATLGVDPQGTYATVAERIAAGGGGELLDIADAAVTALTDQYAEVRVGGVTLRVALVAHTEIVANFAGATTQDKTKAVAAKYSADWTTVDAMPTVVFSFASIVDASSAFRDWENLESVNIRDASAVTDMGVMFWGCTSLVTVPLFDTSAVTNMSSMFRNCSALTTVPTFDTSAVTNMANMFYGCSALTTVPALDVSAATQLGSTIFNGCSNLTSILAFGFKVSFSVANTALDTEALNTLFDNLADDGETVTITGTPGAATCDRSIATAKGWRVTG